MKVQLRSLLGASLLISACAGDAPTPQTSEPEADATAGPVVDPRAPRSPLLRSALLTGPHAPRSPLHTGPERASWPGDVAVELVRGCSGSVCPGSSLAIDVTSLRRDPVTVQVFLSADGLDGRSVRVRADGAPDGGVELAGGARRRFTVAAAAMPIQPIGSLASARAELIVTAGGASAGSFSSSVAYEHDPGFATFTLYTDAAALERTARLDARDIERPVGRLWNGQTLVDLATLPPSGGTGYTLGAGTTTIAAVVDPGPAPWSPPPPSGTHVCFDLKVQYNDAGIGEDYLAAPESGGVPAVQLQNASYMRAWIVKSGVPGTVWDGYLSSAGCSGYSDMSGTYTIYVQSQFEKLVGGVAAHHNVKLWNGTSDNILTWSRSFTVAGAPSTVDVQASSTSRTMNVAGVLARMYGGSDTWVPTGTNTTYVDKGCPGLDPPTDSCYNGSVYIGPGAAPAPPQSNDKFLVAHEYGHFVQGKRFGLYGFNYNAVIDSHASCKCDHVVSANGLHCMQSLEQYAAALIEGFGHFYASKLYNDRYDTDCHFGYYKEVFILFGVLTPTVPVACASTVQWRDSYCSAIPDSAVEMDVMRFLWALYSTLPDRLSMDEIGDLLETAQAQAGFTAVTWSDIQTAAALVFGNPSAKYGKVINQAAIHAVD